MEEEGQAQNNDKENAELANRFLRPLPHTVHFIFLIINNSHWDQYSHKNYHRP